jgi:hypothetical protein
MAEVMADDSPWETKSVLDLGCGSGSWCVFVYLSRLPLILPLCQDNGSCSRLPTLPGRRRRLGPHAIYASGLKFISPMSNLTNIFISEMPQNCR